MILSPFGFLSTPLFLARDAPLERHEAREQNTPLPKSGIAILSKFNTVVARKIASCVRYKTPITLKLLPNDPPVLVTLYPAKISKR